LPAAIVPHVIQIGSLSLGTVYVGRCHVGEEARVLDGSVKDAAARVLQCNVTKAILTLGGNRVNNRDCQPDQLAKDFLTVACSFTRDDSFQKVTIWQLQYR